MPDLDNIGDTNRWEDPRDTRDGQSDAADWHQCHFCGTYVRDGLETDGKTHWLSDCRPDLVEHEIGPLCTWHGLNVVRPDAEHDCYAYESRGDESNGYKRHWTDQHTHFYPDGPM
jgi:hypothetical protein